MRLSSSLATTPPPIIAHGQPASRTHARTTRLGTHAWCSFQTGILKVVMVMVMVIMTVLVLVLVLVMVPLVVEVVALVAVGLGSHQVPRRNRSWRSMATSKSF